MDRELKDRIYEDTTYVEEKWSERTSLERSLYTIMKHLVAEHERLEKENAHLQEILKESENDMEKECRFYNELSTKYTKLQRVCDCAKELLERYDDMLIFSKGDGNTLADSYYTARKNLAEVLKEI